MIKLYSRTVCPKCMLVKQLLNGSEIPYEVINLDFDMDAFEEIQAKGFMALPIALDVETGTYYTSVPEIQSFINTKKQSL